MVRRKGNVDAVAQWRGSRPAIESPVACAAPFLVLEFDPVGNVAVCCANSLHLLGSVSEHSIRELWTGSRAQQIRDALLEGDLDHGCSVCRHRLTYEAGEVPRDYYDTLPFRGLEPDWPALLVFSLHNTCNLECTMCGGDASSRIRTRREGRPALGHHYGDAFFEQLPAFIEHAAAVEFRGGEPFLVREHHRVWDIMRELDPKPVNVTTNGTVWNERVEQVLADFPTSILISFDGVTPATFEAVRRGADYDEVLTNVWRFRDYARERGTYAGLSMSLVKENWHELGALLRFGEEHGLDVHVNTVLEPDHGVQRLPTPELEAVVAALEEEDRTLGVTLTTNRRVWERELAKLRAELHARRAPGPRLRLWEPPHLRNADHVAEVVQHAAIASRPDLRGPRRRDRAASERLAAWSPSGSVGHVDLDPSGRLVAVDLATVIPTGYPSAPPPGELLGPWLQRWSAAAGAHLWIAEELVRPGESEHVLLLGPQYRDRSGLVVRAIGVARLGGEVRLHVATDASLLSGRPDATPEPVPVGISPVR